MKLDEPKSPYCFGPEPDSADIDEETPSQILQVIPQRPVPCVYTSTIVNVRRQKRGQKSFGGSMSFNKAENYRIGMVPLESDDYLKKSRSHCLSLNKPQF